MRLNGGKPGRTRVKLAEALTKLLGFTVEPEDLHRNPPAYATVQADGVSWDADVKHVTTIKLDDGRSHTGSVTTHIYSWTSMGELIKRGMNVRWDSHRDVEVFRKD